MQTRYYTSPNSKILLSIKNKLSFLFNFIILHFGVNLEMYVDFFFIFIILFVFLLFVVFFIFFFYLFQNYAVRFIIFVLYFWISFLLAASSSIFSTVSTYLLVQTILSSSFSLSLWWNLALLFPLSLPHFLFFSAFQILLPVYTSYVLTFSRSVTIPF